MSGLTNKIFSIFLVFFLFAAIPTMADRNTGITLPVEYYDKVQELFGEEQWQSGKKILDAGLKRYPDDSNLNALAGKYWLHEEDYDKARFYLVKAVNANYNNVEAKQMLVTVEDVTGNYSSAICYINELLEVNPYWEGLWRKKIELYKKQGNTREATRLFKRLQQIYPNNDQIKDAYYYELEVEYEKQKQEGNLVAVGNTLRELVSIDPKNIDYQLALINHYYNAHLMEKAIEQASVALAENPGNITLLRKKVGILNENGQLSLAMARVQYFINSGYNTPEARALYNELLLETARQGHNNEPYTIYGKIFEKDKNNREALDFLLRTAIMRGYHQDAIYYLKEAKRIYGINNKKIRYMEYELYRSMGNDKQAISILSKLHEDFPDDYDIAFSLCTQKLALAETLANNGAYSEAIPELKYVVGAAVDVELTGAALNKLYSCYIATNKYEEAYDTYTYIKPLLTKNESMQKEAELLYGLGRKEDALQIYTDAIANSTDTIERKFYINGYEELAVPYIKDKMEKGEYGKAYSATVQLLDYLPSNYLGLLYAVNIAGQMNDNGSFDKYTALGREAYPNDPYFMIKQAAIYNRDGDSEKSVALLRGNIDNFTGNVDYINAYSGSCEMLALARAKDDKHAEAIQTIDDALRYNPNGKSLLYTKGVIYEQNHQYDSAFHYQKYYEPSPLELNEYMAKLKGLRYRSNKNRVDYEYMQARFSEQDVITSVASIGYERVGRRNIYSARLNYSGRNGSLFWNDEQEATDTDDGGTGYQLLLGFTREFNSKWTGNVSIGAGCSYFPKFIANVGATRYLNNDWYIDAGLGYRRLMGDKNLCSFNAAANKVLEPFTLTAGGALVMYDSELFFNVQAKAKYAPIDDGRTSVTAAAGVGTAPELNIIDLYSISSSFSHMNTYVSLGGQYLITPNLSLGLLGIWNTLYDQKHLSDGTVATQYRNLYNGYVQIFISF